MAKQNYKNLVPVVNGKKPLARSCPLHSCSRGSTQLQHSTHLDSQSPLWGTWDQRTRSKQEEVKVFDLGIYVLARGREECMLSTRGAVTSC